MPLAVTLGRIATVPKNKKGAPPERYPWGKKIAVRRPGAKEGGREEEEKRSGIAARRAGRLRSNENHTFAQTFACVRSSHSHLETSCVANSGGVADGGNFALPLPLKFRLWPGPP
jgi:hypothetical protein